MKLPQTHQFQNWARWLACLLLVGLASCRATDDLTGTPSSKADVHSDADASGTLSDTEVLQQADSADDGQLDDGQADNGHVAGQDVDAGDAGKDGKGPDVADNGIAPDAAPGSCYGKCGLVQTDDCSCDIGCDAKGTCCTDYGEYCSGTIGICGEGLCHPEEVDKACTIDCEVKGDPLCLFDNCPAFFACQMDAACSTALACLKPCNSGACSAACLVGVPGLALQYLSQMKSCACMDFPMPLPQVCGDGGCVEGESGLCPADCDQVSECDLQVCVSKSIPAWLNGCDSCQGQATTAAEKCAQQNCPLQWSKCDYYCRPVFACMEQIDSLEVCPNDNPLASELLYCANLAGCFAPTTSWSCAGKCGQVVGEQPCSCHPSCHALGNCCKDFVATCPDLAATHCGDGTCQPDLGESAATCTQDCGKIPCINKGFCNGGQICCGTPVQAFCVQPGECQ